jgi:hypothetical protein
MADFQERIVDIKREIAVVACVMVAARAKAWDSGHTIAGNVGSNPVRSLYIFLL